MADDIDTVRAKVKKGMEKTREDLADEPELLAFAEKVHQDFEAWCSQFIISSIGLYLCQWKTKEANIHYWRTMKKDYDSGFRPTIPEC